MKLIVICAWCDKFIGFKDAQTDTPPKNPISHGMCADCRDKLEEEISNIKGGNYET